MSRIKQLQIAVSVLVLGLGAGLLIGEVLDGGAADGESDQPVTDLPSLGGGSGSTSPLVDIRLGNVMDLNPEVNESYSRARSICGGGAAYSYQAHLPRDVTLLVFDGQVYGVRAQWLADEGWGEWASTPEDEPSVIGEEPNQVELYSQTVFFKNRPTDEQCEEGVWGESGSSYLVPAGWDAVKSANTGLENEAYSPTDGCKAGRGVLRGPVKTGLQVLTFDGVVIGFQRTWGAGAGWLPWAEQPEGEPASPSWAGDREVYFQQLFFRSPPSEQECAELD